MRNQMELTISTHGPGLTELTRAVAEFVDQSGISHGLLTAFVRHTSCSLLIQENADPDVQVDLNRFFSRLVPPGDDPTMSWLTHVMEGADDMPAHIKAALTAVSVGIPISNGQLVLGTWQGLYLFEHRRRPHSRKVFLHISG